MADGVEGRALPLGGGWLPTVALFAVTAVFGWTFVVVKGVLAEYPLLPYLGLRFGIAVLALGLLLRQWPRRSSWRVGLPIGVCLAAGFLLQTKGMETISPGIAGLLTGLFVVFIPVLDRVMFKSRLRVKTMVSIAVALLGTGLLAGGGTGFSMGDLLVVFSALAFAVQIVLLSHTRGLAGQLGLVQVMVCAAVFLALGTTGGVPYPAISGPVALALLATGVLASALAQVTQTWAQQRMSASRAGLILAAEPAMALFFAMLLVGERLDLIQLLGAVLLMAAIVGHEIATSRESAGPARA
jgi:drug/metabolite transporter (DMT)-like permease